MLLNAKADPNLPILPSPNNSAGTGTINRSKNPADQRCIKRKDEASTALLEACLHRDVSYGYFYVFGLKYISCLTFVLLIIKAWND